MILAIDPGNERSGFLFLGNDGLIAGPFGKVPNAEILEIIRQSDTTCKIVCEFPFPRGQTASWELFKTVEFIGQIKTLVECDPFHPRLKLEYIDRQRVKLCVCGSASAKDANIRAALIAIYGEPGSKKNPGPTYGITADVWAALGIAHTYSVEGESLSKFLRRRDEIKAEKAEKKARQKAKQSV